MEQIANKLTVLLGNKELLTELIKDEKLYNVILFLLKENVNLKELDKFNYIY